MKADKLFIKYKVYILKVVEQILPVKRRRIYSNEYYLSKFVYVLNNNIKWELLYDINKPKCHWKTIYNEYLRWSSNNIFKIAWELFMKNNYFRLVIASKSKYLKLFIDVTKINNKRGVVGITINNEYSKKNITPLTIIGDNNNLPISVSVLNYKTIYKNGRRSCSHDVSGIQTGLDNIPLSIPQYMRVSLTGDKGYITSNSYTINNKNVKIVSPYRKNQKTVLTSASKKLLRQRYKIEHIINNLKSLDKLFVRNEKLLHTYMSFIYISFIQQYYCYIEKLLHSGIKFNIL